MSAPFTNQKKVEENFSSIFNNKGIFSAVGEKTINNYKSKFVKGKSIQPNLHYFAVGHTFKNIDAKRIFGYQLTDDEKDMYPTQYISLQPTNFSFNEDGNLENDVLSQLLNNIRNINAHYIHDFELIEINNIDTRVLNFIKESFEVALIKGIFAKRYGNLKDKLKVDFLSNEEKENILTGILNNLDLELIQFMKEIFYQTLYTKHQNNWGKNVDFYKEKKQFLDSYLSTKREWIDWILFNEVEENFEWELNPKGDNSENNHKHKVLDIKKGKYLSFEGCLFIMSMFLYANEANYLIPKLKGYKKNKESGDNAKLEVFRFFSKKFKSQDIDSEHNQLVKFRDIVQYLGKFPVKWNSILLENTYNTNRLKDFILEKEIESTYIYDLNNYFENKLGFDTYKKSKELILKDFIVYSKQFFLGLDNTLNSSYTVDFNIIINTSADYLNLQRSLKTVHFSKKGSIEYKLKKADKTNKVTLRLKQRIENNLLYISNGRNNDRFIEFATRYLVEVNYFGKDAQFKMYENYFSEEEQNSLKEKEVKLDKKAFDKLHYHGGKLTHFSTYENHLKKYPDWEMPFVVQNNAIYVKIKGIDYQNDTAFCIQRDLLNYLVENALEQSNPENKGKELLLNYFKVKNDDFEKGKKILEENKTITSIEKTALKKLFPKRLLHNYCPPNQLAEKKLSFYNYLNKAKESENRYEEQKRLALEENRLDLFLNKNKGKQYKLKFIFKAWQLMFFREQYDKNKQGLAIADKQNNISRNEHEYGHHKNLNITRDEYNLFSKWMFAMDEVTQYKNQLEKLLNEKGVLENQVLNSLFSRANSLDDLFKETILVFENWLEFHKQESKGDRFHLVNYKEMMAVGNIHINLSHFLEYAIQNKIVTQEGKSILRPITKHAKYLYEAFYNIDLSHQNATNVEKNQYRKLYKNRLEDCLLYEIATRYLQPNQDLRQKSYNHLSKLLIQDIVVEVKDVNNQTYIVKVPFKDLEKFAQLQYLDELGSTKFSLFKRLPNYLKQVANNREKVLGLKDMVEEFKNTKTITLAHISMLNNHLITQQGRYTSCIMAMEEYFIWKNKFTINQSVSAKPQNRIVIYDIPILKEYFKGDTLRNVAFHMDLPLNKTYKDSFLEKELLFVDKEVKTHFISNLNDCPYMLKNTLIIFMNQMHDEIKMSYQTKDTLEQRKQKKIDAENSFFDNLIK